MTPGRGGGRAAEAGGRRRWGEPRAGGGAGGAGAGGRADRGRAAAPPLTNPKPWETVVRIKVHDAGAIGLGSGTIIHSTPQESIILTCAHIFKLQGGPQPTQAAQFPRKITVDLFDGRLTGPDRMVHKVE